MCIRVVIALLLFLNFSSRALAESMQDKLKRARQTEKVDKLDAENVANRNTHLSRPNIIVRLKRQPSKEEISSLTRAIVEQSSRVTNVRYSGQNTLQVTLDSPMTDDEFRDDFRSALMAEELVLDVEVIKRWGASSWE